MSPADYPLGSLESRSIARAWVEHASRTKTQLSEYERDALTIYRFARLFLNGNDLSPSLRDVEQTVVYQHGRGLAEKEPKREPREDPVSFLEELFERRGLEPPPRDAKWRESFLWCAVKASVLVHFQEAWERQLAHLPFPIRPKRESLSDARLYLRRSSGEWTEETDELACRTILGPVKELQEWEQEEQER
jgi:hypothetical protein